MFDFPTIILLFNNSLFITIIFFFGAISKRSRKNFNLLIRFIEKYNRLNMIGHSKKSIAKYSIISIQRSENVCGSGRGSARALQSLD